ncbi:hypothetical protein AJ80_04954 [Polytolypa hystricis UAMH7299]|uniref:NEDD8-activating enzyme E1 regulatory subunit n=1 Tax=Polytolypa hystricis (strain UAMH7299) TaxID=1447883 RepID=A0A2B7Y7P7_POLH7|nr:hypothetical protein AJ80_04954 [Polytolypa hystricis UAMH7299]
MTESLPAQLAAPSSKERKYDRQLRLWAASGQQALESSRILLVNSDGPLDSNNPAVSGVAGVETLKNLVLPGVGGFTIVDPAVVTESDLGVNFFVEEESLGKSRAEETCKFLLELNPDVEGDFSSKPILDLLQDASFLPRYKLIIVTAPIRRSTLRTICDTAQQLSIPVIYTHSVGFYAAFSLQLPSIFPIVETHPSPESMQDLRLTNPWPELAALADQVKDLDALDDLQHGHVPYVLLLLHYLQKWRDEHEGRYPENYKEKSAFRDLVRQGARTNNPEGGEENFDEAVAAVLKSVSPWSLSSGVRDIFNMDQCLNLNAASGNFWIIANAIKAFHAAHGVLPVPGSLPDMKAQSADYIRLQNIYKSKARRDLAEVVATVRTTENQLRGPLVVSPIAEKEIEIFCKNAAHVKVLQGRSIPHIQPDAVHTLEAVRQSLENPESLVPIFIALQALDALVTQYQETHPAAPSSSPPFLDDPNNWSRALSHIISLLESYGQQLALDDTIRTRISNALEEVKRAGGGELHNISSLVGGLVAQEALKVLTRQYVALDNTFVFDGIGSVGEMFRL